MPPKRPNEINVKDDGNTSGSLSATAETQRDIAFRMEEFSSVAKTSKMESVINKMMAASHSTASTDRCGQSLVDKLRNKMASLSIIPEENLSDPDSLEWLTIGENNLSVYFNGVETFSDDIRAQIFATLVVQCFWNLVEQGKKLETNAYSRVLSKDNESFLQGFISELSCNDKISDTTMGKKGRSIYLKGRMAAREKIVSTVLSDSGISQKFWRSFAVSEVLPKTDSFRGYKSVLDKMGSITSESKLSNRFQRVFDYFVKLYIKANINGVKSRVSVKSFLKDFQTLYKEASHLRYSTETIGKGKKAVVKRTAKIAPLDKPYTLPGIRVCEQAALKDLYRDAWVSIEAQAVNFENIEDNAESLNESFSSFFGKLKDAINNAWKTRNFVFSALKARRMLSKKKTYAEQVKWLGYAVKRDDINKDYAGDEWSIEPLLPTEIELWVVDTATPQNDILKKFSRTAIMSGPEEIMPYYPNLILFIRKYNTAKALGSMVHVNWAEEVEGEYEKN